MATPDERTSPLYTSPSLSGGVRDVPHTRLDNEQQLDELYVSGDKLGEGTFGVVWLVTHRETAIRWACKMVNKEKAGSSKIKLLEREVDILKKVNQAHIIRLQEVFETSKKMYLIMEYCSGGELADAVKTRTFEEEEVKTIIQRLASAIAYLHKKGMVHRDLKLENILLAENPHDFNDKLYIKVTDFGLSVMKGGVGHENMMMDFCGTPMYMSPEIIDNKTYSEMCDIWAMGVITFILLSGSPPFIGATEECLYEMVKTTNVRDRFVPKETWSSVSAAAKDCICGMLHLNPAHRLTAHEILDHAWLTGKVHTERPKNVLEMMKEWRNDMEECREEEEDSQHGSSMNGKETTTSGNTRKTSESKTTSASSSSKGKKTSMKSMDTAQSTLNATTNPTLMPTKASQNRKAGGRSPNDTRAGTRPLASQPRTSQIRVMDPTTSTVTDNSKPKKKSSR